MDRSREGRELDMLKGTLSIPMPGTAWRTIASARPTESTAVEGARIRPAVGGGCPKRQQVGIAGAYPHADEATGDRFLRIADLEFRRKQVVGQRGADQVCLGATGVGCSCRQR
jgi:hypothetical protein